MSENRGYTKIRQEVFGKIVQHYNQYGSRPTITSIAKELNLSKQRVSAIVGWLVKTEKLQKFGSRWTKSKYPLIKE